MARGDALAKSGNVAAASEAYTEALIDFDDWAEEHGSCAEGVVQTRSGIVINSPVGEACDLSEYPIVLADMPLPLQLACALLCRRAETSSDKNANGIDARRALQLDRGCECTFRPSLFVHPMHY